MADYEPPYFELGEPSDNTNFHYVSTGRTGESMPGGIAMPNSTQYPGIIAPGRLTISGIPLQEKAISTSSRLCQEDFGRTLNFDMYPGWGRSYCWTSGSCEITPAQEKGEKVAFKEYCHGVFCSMGSYELSDTAISSPANMHENYGKVTALYQGRSYIIAARDSTITPTKNNTNFIVNDEIKKIVFPVSKDFPVNIDTNFFNLPSFSSFAQGNSSCVYAYVVSSKGKTISLSKSRTNKLATHNYVDYNNFVGDNTSFKVSVFWVPTAAMNMIASEETKKFTMTVSDWNPLNPNGPISGEIVIFNSSPGSIKYMSGGLLDDLCATDLIAVPNEFNVWTSIEMNIEKTDLFLVHAFTEDGDADAFYITTKGEI